MEKRDEEKHRNLKERELLNHLREEVAPNEVIDHWVTPLENYRDTVNQDVESCESFHDPVLCEFGELTRSMLHYYNVATADLFPDLRERIGAEKIEESKVRAREDLMDAATRLQNALQGGDDDRPGGESVRES